MEDNHTCLNCGHSFVGNFCNRCGEKVYTEHDKSVPHLFEEAFHFFTHFEGKFFNTLKSVLFKPGKLSVDYCMGLRRKYFKPLSFFLLLVILYLLFPVFEGLNMRLMYHERHGLYGSYATEQVQRVKEETTWTDEELAEAFHHKGEKTSKFLLFVIIPVMALASWGLGFKKRRLYFDHFIFSTEAASILILAAFLLFPAIIYIIILLGIPIHLQDGQTGVISVAMFSVYVGFMARRFFSFTWWYNIIFTAVFVVFTMWFLMNIYKFILFWITVHLL